MELKDLLGADYKEGMTAEEIAAALTTKSFVSKDVFDKTASDLASVKKASKTHETDLASQLEAQRQQIEQLTISGNRHEAARILSDGGISKEAYDTFIDQIVGTDAEKTSATATAIAAAFKAYGTATANKVKADLATGMKAPSGSPSQGMTKDAFMKLTFPEQVKFKTENPNEYAAMFPKP